MNTFLPYEDFAASVQSLDWRRLGKQRVEAYQVLRILLGIQTGPGWRNHPCVLMWTGREPALKLYHNLCIEEWQARGFRNTMVLYKCTRRPRMPWWMGRPELHLSHQSNLIRKQPEHYAPLFPGVSPDIPYWWPTEHAAEK